ncbi:MAG TPA: EthD domain-containing protein [Pseudomonadales bacterium]|nr:EthD domain-containing protein [Pseudomonadales bacterium]
MEKLVYLLWQGNSNDTNGKEDWHVALRELLVPELRAAGASRLRLNLADRDIEPAQALRLTTRPPAPDAMVSLWLDSASQRRPVEAALLRRATSIAGYAVCESEPLRNTLYPPGEGERCHGMNHVVFLQIPPRLDREQWQDLWLEQHTPTAIDTQQTFGYRQNIVVRTLTADAPRFDAIVEENFPPAAMRDQNAFYRDESPELLKSNQKKMYESCKRFIDFDKMDRLPTSEYNYP